MNRQHRLILVASILTSFVAFLDMTVVNVALPAIRGELGGGLAAQQWTVDAYLLTLGSLMPAAGSISDLFGRKRVLALGLVGFGVASLACAAAPTLAVLVLARAVQGAAGALLVPSSLALIVANFSGPEQTKAIGTWTAWSGISTIAGPLLGGVLVDHGSWRWVFAINVLPIAATLAVLALLEPEPPPKRDRRVDVFGAALCAVGLGAVMFALIELPTRRFAAVTLYATLAAGVCAFAGFVAYERSTRDPMVDLRLFAQRNFAVGNGATLAIYAGLSSVFFLVTVFLQQVAGYSATVAGLSLMPMTLLLFVVSPLAGGLSARYGPRWLMTFGPLLAAVGVGWMTSMGPTARYLTELLPGVLLLGLGLSLTVAPLTAAVLGCVDPAHAGIASAVNNAVARVAGLLSVAALGAVTTASFAASLDEQAAHASLRPTVRAALERLRDRPLDASVPPELSEEAERVRPLLERASVVSLETGLWSTAALLVAGGLVSAIGITNRRRP